MSSSAVVTKLVGNFGRLWRRGHESFTPDTRRILSVKGKGATTYLQGLVTSDLLTAPIPPKEEKVGPGDDGPGVKKGSPNPQEAAATVEDNLPLVEFSERLRSTCFLDNKGRIVTDSLLWKVSEEQYYIDVPGTTADVLLNHLKQFVLRRSKVKITDQSDTMASHVVFGTLMAQGSPPGYLTEIDPRHPSLGMRVLALDEKDNNVVDGGPTPITAEQFEQMMSVQFPKSPGTYNVIRKLAGVAEGIEITGKIALETNQEFLNGVSFSKGCYLGQELTARVQYTGAIRKRIMPLLITDVNLQVPQPWILASQIQQGREPAVDDDDDDDDLNGDHPTTTIMTPSKLPRISAPAAGAMVAMMTGSLEEQAAQDATNGSVTTPDEIPSPDHPPIPTNQSLLDRLQQIQVGDKIINEKDGKTIGQVVAGAELGTNVILAQMRLDAVGLLGSSSSSSTDNKDRKVWSHLNKVTIGDDPIINKHKFRYLPYLPLWWPDIDPETGKAKEE